MRAKENKIFGMRQEARGHKFDVSFSSCNLNTRLVVKALVTGVHTHFVPDATQDLRDIKL